MRRWLGVCLRNGWTAECRHRRDLTLNALAPPLKPGYAATSGRRGSRALADIDAAPVLMFAVGEARRGVGSARWVVPAGYGARVDVVVDAFGDIGQRSAEAGHEPTPVQDAQLRCARHNVCIVPSAGCGTAVGNANPRAPLDNALQRDAVVASHTGEDGDWGGTKDSGKLRVHRPCRIAAAAKRHHIYQARCERGEHQPRRDARAPQQSSDDCVVRSQVAEKPRSIEICCGPRWNRWSPERW